MSEHADLIADIDAYCAAERMTASAFGRAAIGDPSFVFDLRQGRRIFSATETKVRTFMAPAKEERTANLPTHLLD